MRRAGFTLIEIVMVVTIIGIMLAVAIPYFRGGTEQGRVRGGADAVATMHAVAKQSAIQRGRMSMLVFDAPSSLAWVVSRNVAGTAWEPLGRVENLNTRFGVRFTTTRDTLRFTPRGIGQELSATTIVVSKGSSSATLTITAAGRLIR